MYLSILILPLLGFFLATNRKTGKIGGTMQSKTCMQLSVIQCLMIFYEVGLNGAPVHLILGDWINYGNIQIEWNLLFDSLTVTMYLPIVIISFFIQVYSLEYMGNDPQKILQFLGTKLPNSGDTLKFMVPSHIRKYVSGKLNELCMVRTHKIDENRIGYCGSKSKLNFVKEQRVDGSWYINFQPSFIYLRCILAITVRFWKKIEALNNKTSHLLHRTLKTPWAQTGFIDAEGSFMVHIKSSVTGWAIEPKFQINLK